MISEPTDLVYSESEIIKGHNTELRGTSVSRKQGFGQGAIPYDV